MSGAVQGPRRRLLRATGWFASVTALAAMLLGVQYLVHYQWPSAADALIYSVLAYFSHFALLAYLPWLLLILPLILLLPRPWLVWPISVGLAAAGLAWLLLDALLFGEHQFHLNALTMTIMSTQTWVFGGVYLLMFVGLGAFAAKAVWRRSAVLPARNRGVWVGALVLASLTTAQAQHIWADANYYVPITRFTHYLPLYQPATAKGLLVRHGLVDLDENRERELLARAGAVQRRHDLYYPQAPMSCRADAPALNLLVVVIDAMRADMLNPTTAPNLHRLAGEAARFEAHYSGGNSSRMGMFSMFYGLPATYWQNIEALQIPPVLVSGLRDRGYQLGVFGSAPLYRPVSLDRTAFAGVADLRIRTDVDGGAAERDQAITREWRVWLDQRDTTAPFFGFLYYDAPTAKDFPDDHPQRFEPTGEDDMARRRADYMTSVHFVDSLFEQVRADLAGRGLLDSTVLMVTADHGEEFDENGLGFKGHGTAYSRSQLHVPLLVRWPGRPAQVFRHRSSHNDWVVTLVEDLLGCSNPPSDYASGRNLFDAESWPWLIAGSYHNFAILEPQRVTVSQFGGSLEVRDPDYRIVEDPVLDRAVIASALAETSRFYERP